MEMKKVSGVRGRSFESKLSIDVSSVEVEVCPCFLQPIAHGKRKLYMKFTRVIGEWSGEK